MHFPDSRQYTKEQVLKILVSSAELCLKSEHPDVVKQAAAFYEIASRIDAGTTSLAEGRLIVDQLRFQAEHALQTMSINPASNRDESSFDDLTRKDDGEV